MLLIQHRYVTSPRHVSGTYEASSDRTDGPQTAIMLRYLSRQFYELLPPST